MEGRTAGGGVGCLIRCDARGEGHGFEIMDQARGGMNSENTDILAMHAGLRAGEVRGGLARWTVSWHGVLKNR